MHFEGHHVVAAMTIQAKGCVALRAAGLIGQPGCSYRARAPPAYALPGL